MPFRDDLIDKAQAEWEWFGKDTGRADHFIGSDGRTTASATTGGRRNPRKETVDPYAARIADYWMAVPSADYNRLVKLFAKVKGRLDGTVDIAWSAAFISYCMQVAGAGTAFPYAPGHATWIVQAIANRAKGRLKAGLVGYEIGEIALEPGDLIGKTRTAGISYQNAVAKGWFESHSDIVVAVDRQAGVAHTIGGNVGQTVSRAEVAIGADGRMKDAPGWIVHIQNNITAAAPPRVAAAITPSDARVG